MEDFNPSELLAICESILEDGEISGEELYHLADWINNHREACFHWPGNLLVQPLQEVWADGKVTKTEIRQIGRILIRIRKHWAKRQVENRFEQAAEEMSQIVSRLDLSQPKLPTIPFVLRVKSRSDKKVFYEVDLSGPTCTCPDWRSHRQVFPTGHLTRCCKHVFEAYEQVEPEAGWPGWLGAFFDMLWTPDPRQDWMVLCVGQAFILASTAPTGWMNVYAEADGTYDRFGYNVREGRWAYGVEPTNSQRIIKAVLDATNARQSPGTFDRIGRFCIKLFNK